MTQATKRYFNSFFSKKKIKDIFSKASSMDKAAVVTHPHDIYGVDGGKIQVFLKDTDFDDVYYISNNEGFLQKPRRDQERKRECLLPIGFDEGLYERGLEESELGELEEHEVEFLDGNYEELAVMGARRGSSIDNTYESLEEDFDGEVRKVDEMIFPKY